MAGIAADLIRAGRDLDESLGGLRFSDPVAWTYLTTDYARDGYESYLQKFGDSEKEVLFLGMNPGPYGMAQCGVPFGEVNLVRQWMRLEPTIRKPILEHPKRPIEGMACKRSEVSGRRLWGYFSELFPDAEDFFRKYLVINFCPLVWMKESGANLTPDKIVRAEANEVERLCSAHLARVLDILMPHTVVGVGAYAEKQLEKAAQELGRPIAVGKILHPSPASPLANRGWAEVAEKQLRELLPDW